MTACSASENIFFQYSCHHHHHHHHHHPSPLPLLTKKEDHSFACCLTMMSDVHCMRVQDDPIWAVVEYYWVYIDDYALLHLLFCQCTLLSVYLQRQKEKWQPLLSLSVWYLIMDTLDPIWVVLECYSVYLDDYALLHLLFANVHCLVFTCTDQKKSGNRGCLFLCDIW